ncbi:hypothetical protein N1F89_07345 [Aquibium sp. A9E412]|uniref:hypothetical protein n=1 Tax=Aquibium sp. A9E412 TaxID=2976767 RepID=UPI0025B0AF28|nr:hypothetical protein [Aquibium sp. A9E412]MDN2566031.1 hypothetical protein [Aquibium sp. A9E412]
MDERRPSVETRDVPARRVLAFAGGLVAFLVVALVVLALLFRTDPLWPDGPAPAQTPNARSPALQRDPAADLARLRRAETEALDTLGWVDRQAGIARIPIEAAMRLVAERGLPAWRAEGAAPAACPPFAEAVPRAPQTDACPPPDDRSDEEGDDR